MNPNTPNGAPIPPRSGKTWEEAMEITHFPPIAKKLYSGFVFFELGIYVSVVLVVICGLWPHPLTFMFSITSIVARAVLSAFYKRWKV